MAHAAEHTAVRELWARIFEPEKVATTTVKAVAVSGGSADDARHCFRLLLQAIARGRMDSYEFRALSDSAPRIIWLLGDDPRAQYERAKAGAISAAEIVAALTNGRDEIAAEFSRLPWHMRGFVNVRL